MLKIKDFLKICCLDMLKLRETSVPCKFYADTEDKTSLVWGGSGAGFLGDRHFTQISPDKDKR